MLGIVVDVAGDGLIVVDGLSVVDGLDDSVDRLGERTVVVGGGKRLDELAGLAGRSVLLVVEDGLSDDVPSDERPADELLSPAVGAGANNGELAGLVVVIVLGTPIELVVLNGRELPASG